MKNTKNMTTQDLLSLEVKLIEGIDRLGEYKHFMRNARADRINNLKCVQAELNRRGA